MADAERIRIPWKQRWRRFRYGVLPPLSFIACVVLTLWLWQRQGQMPNAVGEVEVVRLPVAAVVAGRLVELPEHKLAHKSWWELFDEVKKGHVIARLDDSVVQEQLAIFRSELIGIRSQEAELRLNHFGVEHDRHAEKIRLTWMVEQHHLDVLERETLIIADRAELQGFEAQLQFLRPAHRSGLVTDLQLIESVRQRDLVQGRIAGNVAARDEAKLQWTTAAQRLQQYSEIEIPELAAVLAPVQAQVQTQGARISHLTKQIENLEIRSPIDGKICAIHCWPTQYVQAGDPIVTVAATEGRYVVTYVRQNQRIVPVQEQLVDVHRRIPGVPAEESAVQFVGPQYEEIPLHQLRDPRVPEWGLPVRIELPKKFHVLPGELIDITFKNESRKRAG